MEPLKCEVVVFRCWLVPVAYKLHHLGGLLPMTYQHPVYKSDWASARMSALVMVFSSPRLGLLALFVPLMAGAVPVMAACLRADRFALLAACSALAFCLLCLPLAAQ